MLAVLNVIFFFMRFVSDDDRLRYSFINFFFSAASIDPNSIKRNVVKIPMQTFVILFRLNKRKKKNAIFIVDGRKVVEPIVILKLT